MVDRERQWERQRTERKSGVEASEINEQLLQAGDKSIGSSGDQPVEGQPPRVNTESPLSTTNREGQK